MHVHTHSCTHTHACKQLERRELVCNSLVTHFGHWSGGCRKENLLAQIMQTSYVHEMVATVTVEWRKKERCYVPCTEDHSFIKLIFNLKSCGSGSPYFFCVCVCLAAGVETSSESALCWPFCFLSRLVLDAKELFSYLFCVCLCYLCSFCDSISKYQC